MSERWKPKHGELYYYISTTGVVTPERFNECDAGKTNRCFCGNCFRTVVEAEAAAEKVKALLLDLHTTQDKALPKLTAEVFERPDCPEWAKYVAVDKDGKGFYYRNKPKKKEDKKWSLFGVGDYQHIGIFDASDWQNSLIERPAKLPDWCKVGEWVWCIDSEEYAKIKSIDDNGTLYFNDDKYHNVYARPARLRQYTADEMRELVGKVFEDKDGNLCLAVSYIPHGRGLLVGGYYFNAGELLDANFTINGQPCGVLEHLENGEWVE